MVMRASECNISGVVAATRHDRFVSFYYANDYDACLCPFAATLFSNAIAVAASSACTHLLEILYLCS